MLGEMGFLHNSYLFKMRPRGVVSKKDMGDFKILTNARSCITLADLMTARTKMKDPSITIAS